MTKIATSIPNTTRAYNNLFLMANKKDVMRKKSSYINTYSNERFA